MSFPIGIISESRNILKTVAPVSNSVLGNPSKMVTIASHLSYAKLYDVSLILI